MNTIQVRTLRLALAVGLGSAACQSSSDTYAVVSTDPAVRAPLMDAVAALEGRWTGVAPDGSTGVTEFVVSSNGSAVREIMMPGTENEMTNMYTLDGNALVMTHYCAGGNQPHMRASAIEGNSIVFEPAGVSDLKSEDEVYMGAMTLVIKDADHIEQHWSSYKAGAPDDSHSMVFEMTRAR